jgi:hypothetical protein
MKVCPKCWHEDCDGNCKSAEELAAEANKKAVREAAERLKKK